MANIYSLDVSAANNTATGGMNWAENQAPSTVNNSARQLSALIAQFLGDIGGDLEAGGTANALTLTANSDFTEYADGIMVAFKASADNTAAATLSVNGVGAKAIRKMTADGEAALDAGDIVNGYTYSLRYSETANSAAGAWVLDWAPTPAARTDYVPIGSGMDYWGGLTPPPGYIFAYGQAVSRTTYAALFALFGTTYGAGDGSTTFNVPDKRGRASFGKDDMGGTSANRLTAQPGGIQGDHQGATGGSETVTLTTAQLASHTHAAGTLATASDGAHTHTVTGIDAGSGGTNGAYNPVGTFLGFLTTSSNGAHTHDITGSTASAGSGDAHNNLPPGIVCEYIIFTGVA